MKNKRFKLGFSLIEISIILLVIGVFIGLISQGGDLLDESKLASAQSLTQTSPVASNESLILWLETSLPESFDGELESGDIVSIWKDRSPYSVEKNDALQNTNSDHYPTFQENVINGIPAIRFDSTNDHLRIDDFELRDAGTEGFAIFVVFKSNPGASRFIMSYKNTINNDDIDLYVDGNIQYHSRIDNSLIFLSGSITPSSKFHILTFTKDLNENYNGFIDGILDGSIAATGTDLSKVDDSTPLFIGSYHDDSYNPALALDGYIAEIIIYNKYVKNSTKKNIEEYLSKKYSIDLN
ncbi:MAG: hypothetical protein ACJAW3_000875 [Lentimonas sp.]|jgi:hypothetical protein